MKSKNRHSTLSYSLLYFARSLWYNNQKRYSGGERIIVKEFYRKAIIKYCDAYEIQLKNLQSKGYINDVDADETRQKNEADIKRFLEEEEAYGRLLLSLEQIQR